MDDTENQLIDFFKSSGATEAQSEIMARQMIKRASQLSEERGWTDVESMQHLLKLFVEAQQN
jgi:hypothetical protein